MKEKDGFIDYPDQQMILYVEKEDGTYGPMQTGSYISAHYIDDYKLKRRNLEQTLREQLLANSISIVKYYMVLEDLTITELASRAGVRKSTVKKHLSPEGFGKATAGEIIRYAKVFNINPGELFQINLLQTRDGFIPAHLNVDSSELVELLHQPSQNPYVTLTKLLARTDDHS